MSRAPLALGAGAVATLAAAAGAFADPPQQVVLPGPVPYATTSPPLTGETVLPQMYLAPRVHVSSDQRVRAGIDRDGRATSVRVRQRLVVLGKGDYQLAVGAPIAGVRPAPGSQSEPGLRTDQVLWAGFSPGRKVLAADVRLRPSPAVQYLPLDLHLERTGDRVVLTVANVTATPQTFYTGKGRLPELARLLDDTRRASLAGDRLTGTFVTLERPPEQSQAPVEIEAPLRVEGELRLPGSPPVTFERVLGDGRPLSFDVEARGAGVPRVHVLAQPAPVVRELRPPGTRSWAEAIRRRALPARQLLERLMVTRLRLVRSDQYQSFLADPDSDGHSRTVYEFETAASPRRAVAGRAAPGGGGGDDLLIVFVAVGSVALAAGGLVAWAHS